MTRAVRALALLAALLAATFAVPTHAATPTSRPEVVVRLQAPPLARAIATSKVLTAAVKARRLDLGSPTSRAYLAELARLQNRVARRISAVSPSAEVVRRFQIVVDGLEVVAPAGDLARLSRIPGVAAVERSGAYGPTLEQSPEAIGAPALWDLPTLSSAGNGMKIGIIDMGIDQKHPYFDAAGYTYPPGFPKGRRACTTPKVIAARGFSRPRRDVAARARAVRPRELRPRRRTWRGSPPATTARLRIDGRGRLRHAPRGIPRQLQGLCARTPEFGLVENASEVIAGIEAAVRDGMDVINMSLGEYETEPGAQPRRRRDRRRRRRRRGSRLGGRQLVRGARPRLGRLSGLGCEGDRRGRRHEVGRLALVVVAGAGALSLRLKPEVSAPGVGSSRRCRAAKARGRRSAARAWHPPMSRAARLCSSSSTLTGRCDQVKSALVQTGRPVLADTERRRRRRRARAAASSICRRRTIRSSSQARLRSRSASLRVAQTSRPRSTVTDAGGGAGSWNVSVRLIGPAGRCEALGSVCDQRARPPRVLLATANDATEPDRDRLRRPPARRHHAAHPVLARGSTRPRLGGPITRSRSGALRGEHAVGRRASRRYRYPDDPAGVGVSNALPGPEQVFRVRVGSRVANFGVRIVGQRKGVVVTPRIVDAGDENRLARRPRPTRRHQPVPRHVRRSSPGRRPRIVPARGALRRRLRDALAHRRRARSASGSGSTTRRRRA